MLSTDDNGVDETLLLATADEDVHETLQCYLLMIRVLIKYYNAIYF